MDIFLLMDYKIIVCCFSDSNDSLMCRLWLFCFTWCKSWCLFNWWNVPSRSTGRRFKQNSRNLVRTFKYGARFSQNSRTHIDQDVELWRESYSIRDWPRSTSSRLVELWPPLSWIEFYSTIFFLHIWYANGIYKTGKNHGYF